MPDTRKWYAVRTRSRCEQKVSSLLAEKGIEHYLPSYRETHQWKDRKKVVELPLFSGYLFVRLPEPRDARLPVLRTEGVAGILGNGEGIEAIPDHEIEGVRQLLQAAAEFQVHPLLREGAWVRVRSGALSGIEGRLTRIKSQSRLVLSVTLLGQSVSTEIDAANVQMLQASAPLHRVA